MAVCICGHGTVYWVYKLVSGLSGALQLCFSDEAVLPWHGRRGMLWDQLMPLLYTLVAHEQAPDLTVGHIGGMIWEYVLE